MDQPPTRLPIHLAIIGAGIAGVTLAIALSEHNPSLNLTIFESRLRFSEISAGVSFGPNAVKAMQLISPRIAAAYESVKAANFSPEKKHAWLDVRHGDGHKAGQLVDGLNYDGDEPFEHCTASRARLLEKLVGLLAKDVDVQFGKRIIDVADDFEDVHGRMRIRFEDGTDYHVDAVVGCDGIRSACRRILLGDEHKSANAVYSGKYAYRKVIDMKKAVAAVGPQVQDRQLMVGKSGHVLTHPIRGGKALNVVAFKDAEGARWTMRQWVVPSSREAILRDFAEWGKDTVKILEVGSALPLFPFWVQVGESESESESGGRKRVCI
jgi:salicylate hydroxylase